MVLGGTGKTGRRVVERLRARGLLVRIGSRSGELPFDWEDQATWGPALLNVGAVYLTYYPELAIPGAVHTEVEEIAKAVGRDIRYVQVSADQNTSALVEAELPPEFVWLVNYIYATVLDGRNAHLSDGVQRALGREPRDFTDYVQAAAAGVWDDR